MDFTGKDLLRFIPEEVRFSVGDILFRSQLRLATLLMGARVHFVPVAGIQTAYLELGNPSRETILILPGFSDLKESYLLFARLLAAKFHCIVVDIPGFGESGKWEESYSIERYASWLVEFTKILPKDKFHIYGNSLGGAIMGEFAYRNPDSILSLIFSCSAGIYIDSEESFYREYREGKNLFLIETEEDIEQFFQRLFYKKPWIPSVFMDYLYLHYRRNKEHYSDIMDGLTRKFILEEGYKLVPLRYKKLSYKTLVVWGENDTLFPVSFGRETASHIPGAVFRVIPECGHLPHLEKPFQLKDEIFSFLAGKSTSS